MNGVHDMGGLQCFGSLVDDPAKLHEQGLFDHDWERDVLAITLAMGACGLWNLDQSRSARETLSPADYLGIGYYRIWLKALERLLLEHGLVSETELHTGTLSQPPVTLQRKLLAKDVDALLRKGAPVDRALDVAPLHTVGDRIRVRNLHNPGHTRLPGYIRNHVGVVHKVHGAHVFPDAHAQGLGEQPQWLYNIRFSAVELWGASVAQGCNVHVDCWEPYLMKLDHEPQ